MREQKINRREILKTLVMLSIPTILEEILSTLLQYVDTAMVGHLGEKATASVSVTTTVTWLVNSIPAALGVAVLSMTAKALGSGDREYLQKIAKQILILVFACGLFAERNFCHPKSIHSDLDGGGAIYLAGCFRLFPDCQSSDDFPLGNDDYGRCDSGNKRYKNADVNKSGSQRNQYPFKHCLYLWNGFGRQRSGNCVRNILYDSRIADVCCVPEKRISPLEVGTFCCGWQSDERVYANWSAGPF